MRVFATVLMLVMMSACESSRPGTAARAERQELLGLVTPGFELPKHHEESALAILRAVRPMLKPGEKVREIHFGILDGVTVYFAKPGFSMHGAGFAKATFDGHEWKIGERWSVM